MGQKKEGKKKLGGARLDMPKIRKNPLIEIVPISTGCLNACTYCMWLDCLVGCLQKSSLVNVIGKTKHARGQLGSYPIEEIVDRIKHVTHNEGVKEIWLTSEDTGAYGRDIDTNIVELLWSILDVLPEPVMLRLGMTNPPYIKEHLEVCHNLHPPAYLVERSSSLTCNFCR
jgi:threonylcarbamoyladenosine tRNA methylthiotransferase CDKAL1